MSARTEGYEKSESRYERPTTILPPAISDRRVTTGRLAVVVTLVIWLLYVGSWIVGQFFNGGASTPRAKVEAIVYLLVVTLLTGSSLAYLMTRLGYMYRARQHRRVPRAVIDEFFSKSLPTVTVIVPSYQEEPRVIRNTLLSAALQEYPLLRVVLLIDNDPSPTKSSDRHLLTAARSAARQVEELLSEPAAHFAQTLDAFEHSTSAMGPTTADMRTLAIEYERAIDYVRSWRSLENHDDPAEHFFDEHVLGTLIGDLSATAEALRRAADEDVVLPPERLHQFHRRLAWTFRASVSSFERKLYANLSHEASKAMNLNSYIGLMGASYHDLETAAGRVLVPASAGKRSIEVPDTDYVLTLDADSVILPEYCLRLVYLLEQTQNADVAVAQTPYSAFPRASSTLERVAGATTDVQYIAHQGMTYYNATFWVGANAVLRKQSLDEIRETTYIGDWPVHRFISDRTVIEDTESTIDLAQRGWRLVNYPERLAYSATPPDFGSLAIQRRRWANGGLIVVARLRRMARERRGRGQRTKFSEILIRSNYLASIAWSTAALLLLLIYPFSPSLLQPILIALPIPYFAAMASDLRSLGYRRRDLARTYGFNLLLIPINLAGVGTSMIQAILSDKSAFGRTPKVRQRTIPALSFIVAPYVIDVVAGVTLWHDVVNHRWVNGFFAAVNVTLLTYAIVAFIGLRHSLIDLVRHVQLRLYKPVRPSPRVTSNSLDATDSDWASILHLGVVRSGTSSISASASAAASGNASVIATSHVGAHVVFQAIWYLPERRIVGYEALSRFADGGAPHFRVAEASTSGSSIELETLLTRQALEASDRLPDDGYLAINASRAMMISGALLSLGSLLTRRLVVEVSAVELSMVNHFSPRLPVGARWCLSDVNLSDEGIEMVRRLQPDQVKIDSRWLAESADPEVRHALYSLKNYCASAGVDLVVQRIEVDEDLVVAERNGVTFGQGYLLGRPRDVSASRLSS
jgi:cellulose synthase/poly-beta-1,6-N-acetylglucosamine synthase-like glycosyltransferase/EAL domain-containing protein (putative c-di-GMP-specific phosphodiesterase class I)